MSKKIGLFLLCLYASAVLCPCIVCAESEPGAATAETGGEEQALKEIQPLIEISDVGGTEGMSLEEVTEAASGSAMSEYLDGATGFSMQYPSVFVFDEDQDTLTAFTEDRKASLTIENMKNDGNLTEETLLEAIRFGTPDASPQKNEQNGCLRVDSTGGNGNDCRTDLYFVTDASFHHIILIYPEEEKEKYQAYIEYMVNSMGTNHTDQG